MHLELNNDEAMTLRSLLQERVSQLDRQINAADSLRFKEQLRNEERCVERILGPLNSDGATALPDWEERDDVTDADRT